MLLISISKVLSWSPLLPAWHHDLHHLDLLSTCRHMVVSPAIALQLLLLQLSLTHSDKVKQLHGICISYNKATTIRLLPVADNFYKTWSSHTITYITSQHALQKQVRRPLLCCCKFYVAATAEQEPFLPTHQKPQHGIVIDFSSLERTLFIEFNSTKAGETDTH